MDEYKQFYSALSMLFCQMGMYYSLPKRKGGTWGKKQVLHVRVNIEVEADNGVD